MEEQERQQGESCGIQDVNSNHVSSWTRPWLPVRCCFSWLWLSGLLAVTASTECRPCCSGKTQCVVVCSLPPQNYLPCSGGLAYWERVTVLSAKILGGHSRTYLEGEILGGFLWLLFAWGNLLWNGPFISCFKKYRVVSNVWKTHIWFVMWGSPLINFFHSCSQD